MTCLDARGAIEAAVESPDTFDSIASHLTTCEECWSHWEGLQSLRQELSQWPAAVADNAALREIRAEVLQKLAARRLWGPRLGWAAVLIVAAGALVAGWKLEQRQPMPVIAVRFEPPTAPERTAAAPPAIETEPTATAPKLVLQEEKSEPPPAVRVAAIISPDPETGTAGGMMLELESKNPNVVLYFLTDNQGD